MPLGPLCPLLDAVKIRLRTRPRENSVWASGPERAHLRHTLSRDDLRV